MKKLIALLLCLMLALCAGCAHADSAVTVPDLTTTRRPIPENEAMAFLKKMGVGWNLGNTFDATTRNGHRFIRTGCEFIDIPAARLNMLQRYIIRIERERKARASGLN